MTILIYVTTSFKSIYMLSGWRLFQTRWNAHASNGQFLSVSVFAVNKACP